MEISKKILISTILIAGFIFLVSITSLYVQTQLVKLGFCPIPIPVLLPAFASLGVFVGSLIYYFATTKIEESKEKQSKVIQTLLEILQPEEKTIIRKLIEGKGEVLQSRISSEFGKVKTFRVLENLRRRGVIVKEQYGKTNRIKLDEKFKQIL